MFGFGIITLQLLIAAHLVASGIFSSKPDKKINEYLVQQLPNNQDVSANLDVASEWLSRLQSEGKADKKLVEGLTAFVAMKGMRADNKCDENTYQIMAKCGLLANNKPFDPKVNHLRRVDLIIRLVGREVAEFCHDKHKAKLEDRSKNFDKNLYDQAIKLFRINKSMINWDLEEDICSIRATSYLGNEYVTMMIGGIVEKMLRDWLRENEDPDLQYLRLMTDELTGKGVVNKGKVKEVTDRYIMEPCQYAKSQVQDIARFVLMDSIFMEFVSPRWMFEIKSPFIEIVPTFCMCRLFLDTGSESVARKAIRFLPEARNKPIG